MSTSLSYYGDEGFSYSSADSTKLGPEREREESPSMSRRSSHLARRRTKSPTQYNGMHRRRRKRIRW